MEIHIVEMHHVLPFDVAGLIVVEEGAVFQTDVTDDAAPCLYGDRAAAAHHALHPDVLEIRDEMFRLGGHVVLVSGGTVGIIGLEDHGLILDVDHVNVGDTDIRGHSAPLRRALETQARIGADEAVVAHDDILHPGAVFAADDEAAMGVEYRIVLDQNVLARSALLKGLGSGAALEADAVIADIHRAPGHQHVLALHDVDAVAVLGIPGTAHLDVLDDDVLAETRHKVELGRILDRDAADMDPLAGSEADQMGTQFLLAPGVVGDVPVMLQVIGIPQRAVDRAAHLAEGVPFHVAYLAALDGPPPGAVAVDDALSGDGDVMPPGSRDARLHALAVPEFVLVGRQEDDGAALQMQVDAILEHDGTGQVEAFGHDEMSASLLVQGGDRLLERLGVGGDAVGRPPEIRQADGRFGDDGLFKGARADTEQQERQYREKSSHFLFLKPVQGLGAQFGDGVPVPCRDHILREKLGTHAHGGDAALGPGRKILLRRFDRTGAHDHRPGQRTEHVLHERRTAHVARREDLHQVAAQLHAAHDFGDAAAAGAVRDAAPVCEGHDLLHHAGRHEEISAQLEIDGGRRSVQDGTGAEGHFRAFRPDEGHELLEHLVGAVAAVRELEGADAAVVAGFHDLLAEFDILVVEHRNDAGTADDADGIDFIELCHNDAVS